MYIGSLYYNQLSNSIITNESNVTLLQFVKISQ